MVRRMRQTTVCTPLKSLAHVGYRVSKTRCSNMTGAIVALLVVITCSTGVESDDRLDGWIDGIQLATLLEKLINEQGLNHDILQGYFDTNEDLFQSSPIRGSEIAQQVVDKLGQRFESIVKALHAIKVTAEESYDTFSSSSGKFTECCQINESRLETQTYLKNKVDLQKLCYRVGEDARTFPTLPLSDDILQTMKNNFNKNSHMYWQYIGTEEGTFVTYPARKSTKCNDYDPRYRQWYVETATPTPKDIVIVLDRSESMTNDKKMTLAKQAARTVIDTLNPNDRVGLVYFSDDVSTPISRGSMKCTQSQLAFATSENKKFLSDYVNTIETYGGTKYIPALQAAYHFLNSTVETGDTRKRDKAILFLTDGLAEESSDTILYEITSRSGWGVSLLTFGLGQNLGVNAIKLLDDMSKSSLGNVSLYKAGFSKVVEDAEDLRYEMGSYYNLLSKQKNPNEMVITIPYVDYSGLGLVASICMPLYYENSLKGVTCIDVSMNELISDVEYYHQGSNSYAFIIDGTGRTILHPLLPQPDDLLHFKWEPVFIGIKSLERSSDIDDIIANMQSGGEGSRVIWTTVTASYGQSKRDGVMTRNVKATYDWKKIQNTNFSLCLVVPQNDSNLVVEEGNTKMRSFIYHRLDLNPDGVSKCTHIGRYATKEGVIAKFTPDAFNDPQTFLNKPEDRDAVIEYTNYMEGDNNFASNKFRDGVRAIIKMASYVQDHWKKMSPYMDNMIWRYIGLEAGVFIKYPGTAMDPAYNPQKRPWYRKASAHPGDIILTTPYWDASGAGIVTTIAKTIVQGKNAGHKKSDRMVGVMGLDFKLDTIKLMLHEEFTQCVDSKYSCFLVDTSGYIVYHDDFVKDGVSRHDLEFVHLAEKEEFITQYLLKEKHLFKQTCDDFEPKKTYHTYKLDIAGGVIRNVHSAEPPAFDAQRVPDSNLYAFIKSTAPVISENRCICSSVPSNITKCESVDECECPCFTAANFQYCKNSYDTVQDSPPVCVPDTSQTVFTSPIPNEALLVKSLEECFIVNCSTKNASGDCNAVPACSWCSLPGLDGCYAKSECSTFPSSTTPETDPGDGGSTGGSNPGVVLGAVLGGLLVVGALLALLIVLVIRRKRKQNAQQAQTIHDFKPDSESHYTGESRGHVNPGLRLSTNSSGDSGHEDHYSDLDLINDHPRHGGPIVDHDGRGVPPPPPGAHQVSDTYLTARQSKHDTHPSSPTTRQHMM